MKRGYFMLAAIVVAALAGTAIFAQPAPSTSSKPAAPVDFVVTGTGEGAIMVERTTGQAWVLAISTDGTGAWLPIQKIDDPNAAREWYKKELDRRKGKVLPKKE
jgi:hypothetical protein